MDCIKETIKEGALLLEKMPELFRNGKNTVSVSYCDKLVCHHLGAFLRIKIPTGWTEPGMATKRDKLHVPTLGTGIHSAAISKISKTIRTVQRALVSLTEKGYIKRIGAKRNSTWDVIR